MKTREEQLAEMAKHLCSSFNPEYCRQDCPKFYNCRVPVHCEGLQYAGYRNQSDTAREILDEVSRHFGGAWLVELYKKYGVGMEE